MLTLSLSIPSLGKNVQNSLAFCGIIVPTWNGQISRLPSAILRHIEQSREVSRLSKGEGERNKHAKEAKEMKKRKMQRRRNRIQVYSVEARLDSAMKRIEPITLCCQLGVRSEQMSRVVGAFRLGNVVGWR
jgi:hypothetical protein